MLDTTAEADVREGIILQLHRAYCWRDPKMQHGQPCKDYFSQKADALICRYGAQRVQQMIAERNAAFETVERLNKVLLFG